MIERFLEKTGWSEAHVEPLAGDASRRSYDRLHLGRRTALLMRAPADSAADIERFSRIAAHLRNLGLSAPDVFASDPEAGLMLLEDLGNSLYPAAIAADPTSEHRLYKAAIEALFVLQAAPPPTGLSVFSPGEMTEAAALAHQAYALAEAADCPWSHTLEDGLNALAAPGPVLILRDFHAENLFWLPERSGPAVVGLIDFQDARLASPLYDIVSLLWDARRDLDDDLRNALLEKAARHLELPVSDVRRDAATLNLQRNLRILGVFARLASTEGKVDYLDHIPRVWRHINSALDAPHLAVIAPIIRSTLPAPTPDHLAKLKTRCDATPTP